MTQERLGRLVGLSRTSITNIEKGRQHISLHQLFAIAEALRVRPDMLLPSAGEAVDALWGEYSDAALAVLRTLREPSAAMLAVGDAGVWDRMIHAAIEEESISD